MCRLGPSVHRIHGPDVVEHDLHRHLSDAALVMLSSCDTSGFKPLRRAPPPIFPKKLRGFSSSSAQKHRFGSFKFATSVCHTVVDPSPALMVELVGSIHTLVLNFPPSGGLLGSLGVVFHALESSHRTSLPVTIPPFRRGLADFDERIGAWETSAVTDLSHFATGGTAGRASGTPGGSGSHGRSSHAVGVWWGLELSRCSHGPPEPPRVKL